MSSSVTTGFIGLGIMGHPMALNLVRAGVPLVVWNRTAEKAEALRAAGARVAANPGEVFAAAKIVMLMLSDGDAVDAVLGRGTPMLQANVGGRTIVHMGTTSPAYSLGLEKDISLAGGRYVEAPVSGSRKPAEAGELVALLAGHSSSVETVRPLLKPICREAIVCGSVPGALLTKLGLNVFLLTMVAGLAEAVHFAQRYGLDMQRFLAALNASPMASDVSRVKGAKLVSNDFSAQAAMPDVLKNGSLTAEAAREVQVNLPLFELCCELYREALALGNERADMVAVLRAIEARTHQANENPMVRPW